MHQHQHQQAQDAFAEGPPALWGASGIVRQPIGTHQPAVLLRCTLATQSPTVATIATTESPTVATITTTAAPTIPAEWANLYVYRERRLSRCARLARVLFYFAERGFFRSHELPSVLQLRPGLHRLRRPRAELPLLFQLSHYDEQR